MSRCIQEIMNRELLTVVPETPAQAVRELLRTFRVSAVPVLDSERRPVGIVTANALLDGDGSAGDRMSRPIRCVEGSTPIEMAARLLAASDAHHLVVVDSVGVAVGIVSAPDLLRGVLGIPAHHPATFPHWNDATRSSWTDEWPLDEEHADRAPDTAGVLILTCGAVGQTDAIVWVEACASLRGRVVALAGPALSAEPALAPWFGRSDLRFRAATMPDEADRSRAALGLLSDLEHRPPPGGT